MKRILHSVSVKNITFKFSYNWFKIDIFRLMRQKSILDFHFDYWKPSLIFTQPELSLVIIMMGICDVWQQLNLVDDIEPTTQLQQNDWKNKGDIPTISHFWHSSRLSWKYIPQETPLGNWKALSRMEKKFVKGNFNISNFSP